MGQWESSPDDVPRVWEDIPGAEKASYPPSASLAGRLLGATVKYDDATGRGRTAASESTAPLDQRGMVTLSLTVPVVGEEITATLSDADGGVTNEMWVWESSAALGEAAWTSITGADSTTYSPDVVDAAKLLRVRVTYDDTVGIGRAAVSERTDPVDRRGAVTLSSQTPVVGEPVTATLTDADGGLGNEAWQWERSPGVGEPEWRAITGAESARYTPMAPADGGVLLRVSVSYDDGTGTGRSATSVPTDRVDQRGEVTLSSGVPDVGFAVTAMLTDADGGLSGVVWQWQRSLDEPTLVWSDISDTNDPTYTPVAADEGMVLRAGANYDDGVGSGRSEISSATEQVGKPGSLTLDSTAPQVGALMTATLADADGNVGMEAWQWESSSAIDDPLWEAISAAASASYTPVVGDAGEMLRVVVVYSDATGEGRMARSVATERVDQQGTVMLAPSPPVVGKPVRGTLEDPDGMETNQVWRWEKSPGVGPEVWTVIAGGGSSSYTPVDDDSGVLLRVIVTYDDGTGTGRSVISEATERVDREGMLMVSPSPPVAGEVVTATLTDEDGMVTGLVWKWERSPRDGTPVWETIAGAASSAYTATTSDDGGKLLRVTAEYDDAIGGGRVVVSPATLPVDRPGVVSLSTGTPVAGEAIMAELTDDDGGIRNRMWQWESSPDEDPQAWTVVSGASTNGYVPEAGDAGRLLRVAVAYDDATGTGRTATSDATAQVDQLGVVTLSSTVPDVGIRLMATLDDPDGMVTGVAWQWRSSPDQAQPSWSNVAGAVAATYTPVAADEGMLLLAMVTYDDTTGSGRTVASPATSRVGKPGTVTLSGDGPEVGIAVTATLTDPDGSVADKEWQWQSSPGTGAPDWVDISGAQSETYTPVAGDAGKLLRAVVNYGDASGAGRTATSLATGRVDQKGSVGLTSYLPVVGVELTATLVDPDITDTTPAWRWESSPGVGKESWGVIPGAEAATYTPVIGDSGRLLRATATYDDGTGTDRTATSRATGRVDQPGTVTVMPEVPEVGQEVTATLADPDGMMANQVWRWERSPLAGEPAWTSIPGAHSAGYTVIEADSGKKLRAAVTYDDAIGSGWRAFSPATGRVGRPGVVSLGTETPVVAEPLTAMLTDPDPGVVNPVWQWEMSPHQTEPDWTPIGGATSNVYTPESTDAGKLLRAIVVYTDVTASGRMASSPASLRVDQRGTVSVKSRNTTVHMPEVGVWQDAELVDPDAVVVDSPSWQWEISPHGTESERMWTSIQGAQSDKYKPVEEDAGKLLRAVVAYDDGTGTGKEAISPATARVDQPGTLELSNYTELAVGEEVMATLIDPDLGVANEMWHWHNSPRQEVPVWSAIDGAVLESYTLTDADGGKILRATVGYDDGTGVGRNAVSSSTGVVDRPGVVTLSAEAPEAGDAITASLTDDDEGVTNIGWQWQSSPPNEPPNWGDIDGASMHTYSPSLSLWGKLLRATVAYDDTAVSRHAASEPTQPLGRPGVVTLDSTVPVAGAELSANLEDLDGGITGETWTWESSPAQPVRSWSPIMGADSKSYTPSSDVAGMILRASVGYTDAIASGRMARSEATAAVGQPGMVDLSTQDPEVGQAVRATLTDPDDQVTGERWQWESSDANGVDVWAQVGGATTSSYIPVAEDVGKRLKAMVAYNDGTGIGRTATSASTAPVYQPGTVVLSPTTPTVGEPVVARFSHPDGSPQDQAWKWESSPGMGERTWDVVAGAVTNSYSPVESDAGKVLRASMTYEDEGEGGQSTSRSAVSAPSARVDRRGSVTLLPRTPIVGELITATLTDRDAPITPRAWLWERSAGDGPIIWAPIIGAGSDTYTPVVPDDAGKVIRVTVTYDDGVGMGRAAVSTPTERVDQRGEVVLSSAAPDVGVPLVAVVTDPDGDVVIQTWRWQHSRSDGVLSWGDIPAAEGDTYTPIGTDVGMMLRVIATYDDVVGGGKSLVSSGTGQVGLPGTVTLSPAVPQVGVMLTATLADSDSGIANPVWQWEAAADEGALLWHTILGVESANYTPQPTDAGKSLRASVVYTDATGDGRKASSMPTSSVDQQGTVGLSSYLPVVGILLSATLRDPDGTTTSESWQWESSVPGGTLSWETIPGAESASYTPQLTDAGKLLRVSVVYTDATGDGRKASSTPTPPVDQQGTVGLSSYLPVVGILLSATLRDPDGTTNSESWQWESSVTGGTLSWEIIPGAESAGYTPQPTDAGKLLRVSVVYTDATGDGREASSTPTPPVDQQGTVTLSSVSPVVGVFVSAMLGDPDGGITDEAWQWDRSPRQMEPVWSPIAGAQSASYVPEAGDAGMVLRATVTYRDGRDGMGSLKSASSVATGPVDQLGTVDLSTYSPEVGGEVAAILADPDGNITGEVWQWESSAAGAVLSWTPIVGAVLTSYTPTLDEVGELLRVTVVYDDETGAGKRAESTYTSPVRLVVVLAPTTSGISDPPATVRLSFPPAFKEGEQAMREIKIGRPGAVAGDPVEATDFIGDGLVYLLTGEDSAFFEVDPATGQVRIARSLTYLGPGVYRVTVHAASPEGGLDSIKLTITVLQFSIPVFGEGAMAMRYVPENAPVGSAVGSPVKAKDRDEDKLSYALSGVDEMIFGVDASTGQIRTKAVLDREGRSSYGVRLGVEDGRGGQDFIEVGISVSDVNEPPIFVPLGTIELSVEENVPEGTKVGELFMANDPERDRLVYSLSGEDAGAFRIEAATGQMMTVEVLDYEADPAYGLKVGVGDGRGGRDEIEIRIAVTDVDEPPAFNHETVFTFVLPENSPLGVGIGEPVLADDPEADKLVYFLSGDGAAAFNINPETGQVVTSKSLDFESRSSYLLKVSVGDANGRADSIYMTVNVSDVEEESPESDESTAFDPGETAVSVSGSHSETVPDSIPSVDAAPSDETVVPSAGGDSQTGNLPDSETVSAGTGLASTEPATTRAHAPQANGGDRDELETVGEEFDGGVEVVEGLEVAPTVALVQADTPRDSVSRPRTAAGSGVVATSSPGSTSEQFPLWMALVIIALTYIDGIVLVAISYRAWGRPR